MLEKIYSRLEEAIANLNKDNIEELFPLILEDLRYIIITLKMEEQLLSPRERFQNGSDISKKVTEYLAKLGTVYFKHVYGVDIKIINCNDYSLSMAGGGYNSKDGNIYYTDFGVLLSKQSELSFLHTALHEGRHKVQHDQFKTPNLMEFEPHMLRILKENLLEDSLHDNNRKFYTDNYGKLLGENDAEIFARYEVHNLIRKLMTVYLQETNQTEKDVDEILMLKANHIDYMIKTVLREETFNIDKQVEEELYNSEILSGTYDKDGQQVDRLITMDKYIKAHPEFQEEYPVLKLLFDGERPKAYEEIIMDRDTYKRGRAEEEQEHIDKMYTEIISLDPVLFLNHVLATNDIYMLKMFLCHHPTVVTEYQEEIQVLREKYQELNPILNEIIPKNTI